MWHENRKAPGQWLRSDLQSLQGTIFMANRHRRHETNPHPGAHCLFYPLHPSDLQRYAHRHAASGKRPLDHLPHARAAFAQHQRISAKRFQGLRLGAARQRMTGRHDGDYLVLAPWRDLRAQRQRLTGRAFDQGDVERIERLDDFCAVAIEGAHHNVRIARVKIGDEVRQQVAGRRGTGTDAQRATFQAKHGFAQGLGLTKGFAQALGIGQQLLASSRQAHAAAGALVERFAKGFLQQLELAGNSRLRQMQGQGRMADVAVLGNGGERYQLFRGHEFKISAIRILAILNYDFL
ncbi:hypothetical protein D3C76_788380 [compost metagenome]